MKAKIDEDLPVEVAARLVALGHDVQTVFDEGLQGSPDREIWEAAPREGRLLVTQDLDFSDVRRFAPGTHHGVLLIRLRFPSRLKLIARIEEIFVAEDVNRWAGCFVVATERKIRVRRK
jgi:predicted nuclease of predicted toxin-antitoxin system